MTQSISPHAGPSLVEKGGAASVPLLPSIAMPARLVLMRHGESEANVIQRARKEGRIPRYPDSYLATPDREFRLSEKGVLQAKQSGPWLRAQYPEGFDVIFVSDHVRAKETAAHVCLAAEWRGVTIKVDPQLGERNWGTFSHRPPEEQDSILEAKRRDPLHVAMPDGETLLETRARTRILLERVSREFTGKRVLVFTHGEFIEAAWSEIAHLSTDQSRELFHSPAGKIHNCQVVEFSAVDPESGQWNGSLRWMRSSCPSDNLVGQWKRLAYETFTPEQLLERVGRYPRVDSLL